MRKSTYYTKRNRKCGRKMVNLERLPSDLKKKIIQKEGAKKKKIEEKKTSLKSIKKTYQSWRTCAYRLTESTECLAELLKK